MDDPDGHAGERLLHVLICGGGIVGVSTAYFLSRRGVRVTVIERNALACAASGKGGGFLAKGWSDGSPLEPLARRSFALHAQLAEDLGGGSGWTRTVVRLPPADDQARAPSRRG